MRRLVLLAFLALLTLPAAASAAPAAIAPRAAAVSASGATSVELANPTRHALTGRVTLAVGGRTAASRTVRLARRSVTVVRLRLDATALGALRAAGRQRATVTARLRRAGRPATTTRRTLTLRAAAAGSGDAPAPAPSGQPAAPAPGGTPSVPTPKPPAPSNRWLGRMGEAGTYGDFEFTLVDGVLTFTKAPAVLVTCFETGGGNDDWTSGELFAAAGPWTVGTDGSVEQPGVSVNPLVGGRSPRTILYKVTDTTQTPGKVTGTLGMIFYGARTHVFTGALVIVNCAGSASFEAVPA
jgi:hypothetical protein